MKMSKKTKVLKYKVVNTNIDKKFIVKNLDLERVKSKDGPVDDEKNLQNLSHQLDLLISEMKLCNDLIIKINVLID